MDFGHSDVLIMCALEAGIAITMLVLTKWARKEVLLQNKKKAEATRAKMNAHYHDFVESLAHACTQK